MQFDSEAKRLVMRRDDIAACMITWGYVINRIDAFSGASQLFVQFNRTGPGAASESRLDKPFTAAEFDAEKRINSFGIPRVAFNKPLDAVTGYRYKTFDMNANRDRDGNTVPGNLNHRFLLFKPGDPENRCRTNHDSNTLTFNPEPCDFPGADDEFCAQLPAAGQPLSGISSVRRDSHCSPLKDLSTYGNPATGWSGFHNRTDDRARNFLNRMNGVNR